MENQEYKIKINYNVNNEDVISAKESVEDAQKYDGDILTAYDNNVESEKQIFDEIERAVGKNITNIKEPQRDDKEFYDYK